MMRFWLVAAALCCVSGPVLAGSYRIALEPMSGKRLIGHAGVQAVDDRTATALVRVVSPGNEVAKRGTLRVLVMNLGSKPFEFGPDDVTLSLDDGTVLKPTPVDLFEKGRTLVERESRRAGAIDLQNRNNFAGLQQQANSGAMPQSTAPLPGGGSSASAATGAQDLATDEHLRPGAETLNAIYQILIPQPVAPNAAWGGYYVFDVPRRVIDQKSDQPLNISVRTGAEIHNFRASLKWK